MRHAVDLGLRVVLLQHRDRLLPGQADLAHAVILVDYLDWTVTRPFILAAHEAYGIGRALSLIDQGTAVAGRINDLIGSAGTSYEVAMRFRDKAAMRRRLAETGVESVPQATVDNEQDLRAFGERHGYPLVLKPVDGSGSRGVRKVGGPGEVAEAWQWAHSLVGRPDLKMAHFFPVGGFLAERYLDGPEFSVETFSRDGRHTVVGITEKITTGVVEAGHVLPARLAPESAAAVAAHVVRVLDALGLRDGPAHTELVLTEQGPRVIETHDRVGGGGIVQLVKLVYDIDLEQYAVGAADGLLPALPDNPTPRRAAATRFLTARPGRVAAISGVQEVSARPDVISVNLRVGVGGRVAPLVENFDRIGQLIAVGPDADRALKTCEEAAGAIEIVIAEDDR